MKFNEALQHVRSKRSFVNPNEGFQKELRKYELTMKSLQPLKEKEKVEQHMMQAE